MQLPVEELPPLQEAFLNFSFFSGVFVKNKRLYISLLQFCFFMCMQVYICAYGGQRTTSGDLLIYHPLYFETGSLTGQEFAD